MNIPRSLVLLLSLSLSSLVANAAHFEVYGRRAAPLAPTNNNLAARSNMYGTSVLSNMNDISYHTNITLGGEMYSVMIDTGSADLWVAADTVPNSKNSGKSTGIGYAIGGAGGPILSADLEMSGYNVSEQSFMLVQPDSDHPSGQGIIGFGLYYTSVIYNALKSSAGYPPVDNIFRQNSSTPNYVTFLLGRSDDPWGAFPGDFTISEVVPGYEDIESQPKLNVDSAKGGHQHWSVTLDPDGIIGPNGTAIPVATRVSSTKNKQQLTAMFDTGYTLPQVPAYIAEAIYAQISGASLANLTGVGSIWTMNCTSEVNITIKAGGNNFRVHPLDTTMPMSDLGLAGDGCVGTFQPISSNAANSDIDLILGMAFLRNAYLLLGYADITNNETSTKPYVQLLSTSNDTAAMHAEFVSVRLDGVDTTGFQVLEIVNGDRPPDVEDPAEAEARKLDIILASVGGGIILLVAAVVAMCMCRRRGSGSGGVAGSWKGKAARYQPLDEPAPLAATDMHMREAEDGDFSTEYRASTEYHPPGAVWDSRS